MKRRLALLLTFSSLGATWPGDGEGARLGEAGGPPRDIAVLRTSSSELSEAAIDLGRRFYARFPDRYDMLVIWVDESLGFRAGFYWPLSEGVPATTAQPHDHHEAETIKKALRVTRLRGLVWLPGAWASERYDAKGLLRILAHETAHGWGAGVLYRDAKGNLSQRLLGRGGTHWSFFLDTGSSPLGGNQWEMVSPGVWRAVPVEEARYCELDLFLMGLLPAESVHPLRLLRPRDTSDCRKIIIDGDLPANLKGTPPGDCRSLPRVTQPVTLHAGLETVSISQIVSALGTTAPIPKPAPRAMRQAWIYALAEGSTVEAGRLSSLEALRLHWNSFFRDATGGRGRVNTQLEEEQE